MLPRTMFIARTGARLRCQYKGSRHFFTTTSLLRGSSRDDDTFSGKTALVTGGASGIGFQCCKALLSCGCRGVTIVDRDSECGEVALRELAEVYGNEKAVFVNCDVAKSEHVDWAFKTTINAFKKIDIVVNNAGVLNDKNWENEINTNICGTLVGSLLGLQYMAAHCVGHGGIVVNIASTMGLTPFGGCPIYSMTQSGIIGLSRSLGSGCHYDRSKVKVIAMAVGLTETPLMMNAVKNTINSKFSSEFKNELECHKWQKSEVVADAVIDAIRDGESGAIWVVEYGENPYKLRIPCYYDMKAFEDKPSIVECETPGKRSRPKTLFEDDVEEDSKSDKKAEAKTTPDKPPPLACKITCPKVIRPGDPKDAKTKDKKAAKSKGKAPPAKGKEPSAKDKKVAVKAATKDKKAATKDKKAAVKAVTKDKKAAAKDKKAAVKAVVKDKKAAAKAVVKDKKAAAKDKKAAIKTAVKDKKAAAKEKKAATKTAAKDKKAASKDTKAKAKAATKDKKAAAKDTKAATKDKKAAAKTKTPPAPTKSKRAPAKGKKTKSKESKGKSKALPTKSKKASKSKPKSKKMCAGAENKQAHIKKRDNEDSDSDCDDESMNSKSSFDCTRCNDR